MKYLLLIACIIGGCAKAPAPDDSDSINQRSGMMPLTDHLTGCQYLEVGNYRSAAITPRMDSTGKQICNKEQP